MPSALTSNLVLFTISILYLFNKVSVLGQIYKLNRVANTLPQSELVPVPSGKAHKQQVQTNFIAVKIGLPEFTRLVLIRNQIWWKMPELFNKHHPFIRLSQN